MYATSFVTRSPKIAKSGQYIPHISQPTQAYGFTACGGWYPLLLNLSENSSTAAGQKAIQNPQPLHNSSFISTVPRGRLNFFVSDMDSLPGLDASSENVKHPGYCYKQFIIPDRLNHLKKRRDFENGTLRDTKLSFEKGLFHSSKPEKKPCCCLFRLLPFSSS
jgi:hypothetical protein